MCLLFPAVLASCRCPELLPATWWLQRTRSYRLAVLWGTIPAACPWAAVRWSSACMPFWRIWGSPFPCSSSLQRLLVPTHGPFLRCPPPHCPSPSLSPSLSLCCTLRRLSLWQNARGRRAPTRSTLLASPVSWLTFIVSAEPSALPGHMSTGARDQGWGTLPAAPAFYLIWT